MKILKVVFMVLWIAGVVGVVVDLIDVFSGVEPEGVATHIIISVIGIAGHVWISKKRGLQQL